MIQWLTLKYASWSSYAVREKNDKQLRDFNEVYDLTIARAAELAGRYASTEEVEPGLCRGRVLAMDICTDRELPPFDRVAMDGYACRRCDLPGTLRLIGDSAAGSRDRLKVEPETCVKVMTGTVLPDGADMVAMVEYSAEHTDGGTTFVTLEDDRIIGGSSNFSPRGEDVKAGSLVLSAGTVLSSKHIALLASVGYARALVKRLPRVGLLASGNEVIEPEENPDLFQVRNANANQAMAQLGDLGIRPRYYGIVPDDVGQLSSVLKHAAMENDLILMSGGVSMGDYDFAPDAITENGFTILYDRIAVKPGRPSTFAVSERADLFGLPGNPVSSFVITELLVKPYLYRLMGAHFQPRMLLCPLAEAFLRRDAEREEWFPVAIGDDGYARPIAYHGSGHFQALPAADGFMRIDRGISEMKKGKMVVVRPI